MFTHAPAAARLPPPDRGEFDVLAALPRSLGAAAGPKAGGPHYPYRFCAEHRLKINTAAGGNAALLAGVQ